MISDYLDESRDDHKTFYCPSGHSLVYKQASEKERLEKNLKYCKNARDNVKSDLAAAERSRSALKGVITKMKQKQEE